MDELINALLRVFEAKRTHDKACDAYDGYNWGWHGHREIDALNNATDNLNDVLKEVIREVVREELEAK